MIGLRTVGDAIELGLHVVPGASRERIAGEHDGRLRVSVTAPPEDGAANRALLRLIASAFGVRARAVSLAAGASSRRKTVRIQGLAMERARACLDQLLADDPPGKGRG